MSLDLAVVGQDPRFGGGFRSFATTFWNAAVELGREPHLFYVSRAHALSLAPPRAALRPRDEAHEPFRGTAFPSLLPELDALNQLTAGRRIAPRLRAARSVWVVAASAPYGAAALRSGRPYACWLATGLESEWASRRSELPPSRRAALALNARGLRRLERDVVHGARLVYGISPASARQIAESAGLPAERVDWLPIPVDLDAFAPEPDETWLTRLERPTIAFVGRGADQRKNVRLLLEALPAIRAHVPGTTVRLIGEPPHGPFPEGVDIVGTVESIPSHLRSASLLVLPSLQEGFGIVVAEALACGVPVVVTPCGGPEELVRASGGGVVLGGFSAEELAGTAVNLLSDPERLLAMRRAGRVYVEREHSPARLRGLLAAAFAELDG